MDKNIKTEAHIFSFPFLFWQWNPLMPPTHLTPIFTPDLTCQKYPHHILSRLSRSYCLTNSSREAEKSNFVIVMEKKKHCHILQLNCFSFSFIMSNTFPLNRLAGADLTKFTSLYITDIRNHHVQKQVTLD